MRMRMALWSTMGAVWLLTTVASAQGAQPATGKPAAATKPATATPAAATPAAGTPAAATTTAAAPADTAAAPADTAAAPADTAAAPAIDASTYAVRLRDLEQRINDLKERVFRSKSRLSLVGEVVLPDVIGGSKTTIVHQNRMSSSYNLVAALYVLDGTPIFNRADEEGGLSKMSEFDVFNGRIVPGEHSLEVTLKYRGNGIGPFSYLKDYRVTVRGRKEFSAPADTAVDMRVNAFEKGGPTASMVERPKVGFKVSVTDVAPIEGDEAEDDAKTPAAPSGAVAPGGAAAPSGAAGASGSATPGAATGTVGVGGALGGK
jgi:hypothetical protein